MYYICIKIRMPSYDMYVICSRKFLHYINNCTTLQLISSEMSTNIFCGLCPCKTLRKRKSIWMNQNIRENTQVNLQYKHTAFYDKSGKALIRRWRNMGQNYSSNQSQQQLQRDRGIRRSDQNSRTDFENPNDLYRSRSTRYCSWNIYISPFSNLTIWQFFAL